MDFEEKRLNMRIPEYFPPEKESDNSNMESTPLEGFLAQKQPYRNEHDHRGNGMDRPLNDDYHFDKRSRPPPPAPPSSDGRHFKVCCCAMQPFSAQVHVVV